MDRAELWWGHTYGPSKLQTTAVESLLSGKGLWIDYPDVPWREELHEMVKQKIEERDAAISFEFFNADELASISPRELLSKLAPSAMARCLPTTPVEKYVKQQRILEYTIIWIYGLSEKTSEPWLQFSKSCAKEKASLRIVCEGVIPTINAGNIVFCKGRDYISSFDSLLFLMSAVSDRNDLSVAERRYLCTLLNELFALNPEMAEDCLNDPKMLLLDPTGVVTLLFPERTAELKGAIWNAQIKALYPAVE